MSSQEGGARSMTVHLHAVLHRVRDFDRRRPLVWDILLTGLFVTAALTDARGGWRNVAADPHVPPLLIAALSLGLSLPLLWRRRHPLAVLTAMAPCALVSHWTGAMLQATFIQYVAVYNIAVRLPLRHLWWTAALLAGPLAVGAARHPRVSWDQQLVPPLLAFALVALAAIAVRTRRDYTASLVERARRLEVERDQQARLAAAAERTRIAREMHDIIGHNLSVITGLADGGRYAAAKSPERAAQALEAISTTSRQALTELRHLLGVLREHDRPPTPAATPAELSPQPALTDLDVLVDGVRAAGLPVDVAVHGTPVPLSQGRQLAVYRVIQEALTNTLKHAGPHATADVDLTYTDRFTVTITDTGTARPVGTTVGRGLTGMRERAALYGGTVEAGPQQPPATGWRVQLLLPKENPQ
ncbi:sensor histidine kinase [Streptomyces sp. MUM 203J]|uniref:sensor histidine kinase n=1 Tax=Streptomyces sp. MUM 203J TaxID=2791990 RepID=UPI001F04ED3D|nr:histidine kinase [Streptomyces sp. MUM 203J]MCH0538487.1 sensor histidine kinase [Streptomyces sp. MUM 203J]